MIPKLFTIDEVAETLRLSEARVRQLMADGKLSFYKYPGRTGGLRFSEEHIINFLNGCK